MAESLNVKSPCCKASVAYSFYHRYGFTGKRLHRWCLKCKQHYVHGKWRIEKLEDWQSVEQPTKKSKKEPND